MAALRDAGYRTGDIGVVLEDELEPRTRRSSATAPVTRPLRDAEVGRPMGSAAYPRGDVRRLMGTRLRAGLRAGLVGGTVAGTVVALGIVGGVAPVAVAWLGGPAVAIALALAVALAVGCATGAVLGRHALSDDVMLQAKPRQPTQPTIVAVRVGNDPGRALQALRRCREALDSTG